MYCPDCGHSTFRPSFCSCVFAALLIAGCARPDLVPTGVDFDAENVLLVDLENQGEGAVRGANGKIAVFVDGYPVETLELSQLSSQAYKSPNVPQTVTTGVRVSGENRRIAVEIDPDEEIEESGEFQNSLTRTITLSQRIGADLVVRDLAEDAQQNLRIVIGNDGSADSPAGLDIKVSVTMNGSLVREFTESLPALPHSVGATTLMPVPAIPIASRSKVDVAVEPVIPSAEIDNTNNYRSETLPSTSVLTPYIALLGTPKIRNGIVWQGLGGSGPALLSSYADWTLARKQQLDDMIRAIESNEPYGLSAPPALVNEQNHISADDAWTIYLSYVAHALWLDVNNHVSWRLADFSGEELRYLLDSRELVKFFGPTSNEYLFERMTLGDVTPWHPRVSYEFLANLRLIESTQLQTIHRLSDWMRGHLTHIFVNDDPLVLYQYAGPPPVDKILYSLEGQRHVSAGCWGTTGLFRVVLRTVNIPAMQKMIEFRDSMHSAPSFTSVGLAMPHGDDVYTSPLSPSGTVIPSSRLLYSDQEMEQRFFNPPIDCVGTQCNTLGDQASYNHGKANWQLAYEYRSDYILYLYAELGASYLDESLQAPRQGGGLVPFVKPYFDASERAEMIAAVEAEIRDIGRGNIDTGKQKVIDRRTRFLQNK